MEVVVTGSAGFIGSALVERLLDLGHLVIGVDNFNSYYDPELKHARIAKHRDHPKFAHAPGDVSDWDFISQVFEAHRPRFAVNLAAQAGVRYSLENPFAYVSSNLNGFANVLEASRRFTVDHLVYASSSSVYGANTSLPFSTSDTADHPLSLYAATKRSNELMAHSYSHLFGIPTTGLRFFTVYGPWGRPDMALFKFTEAILKDEPIDLYNNGLHRRDFTYIDDVVDGIVSVLFQPPKPNPEWDGNSPDLASSGAPWRIFNIGNGNPVSLLDFVKALEGSLGKRAKINNLPLQPGDILETAADIDDMVSVFGYEPKTSVEEGVEHFVGWYRDYFNL